MSEPCQVCIELQRAGIDVPCSLCEYVPPKHIAVDDVTFQRLTNAIENPRPPNQALVDLFKKR